MNRAKTRKTRFLGCVILKPEQAEMARLLLHLESEGWLYVAVVLDMYSGRVVGWSMQSNMTSQLVADALMMSVWRRGKA